MPISSPELRQVNSTSYADVAGLNLGVDRLAGESTSDFVSRLYRAAVVRRDHSFQGAVNEIALQLGLAVRPGLVISCPDPDALISCDISGIRLVSTDTDITIPLLTMSEDGVWVWRFLYELMEEINATDFSCSSLIEDVPALQLVKQGNVHTVVNEQISGYRVQLEHSGIVTGSERFNKVVPSYTLSTGGLLLLDHEPGADTRISYQYRTLPYEVVCSEVGLLGLLEPSLSTVAVKDGVLAYQLREALQVIMKEDRSYWAR
jgi:hypothetical protein